MKSDLQNAYYRKLRMIYCSELQLISLFPELADQVADFKLTSAIHGLLRLTRERRDEIEMLASGHGISSAGDDCESMRRLIAEGRQQLRQCSRGQSRDGIVEQVCLSVHRLLLMNYSMTRNLAARLGLASDASRLEELIDLIVQRFPDACDHPAAMPGSGAPAMAYH
jgi:ferritin-like metal-binding protein YciE